MLEGDLTDFTLPDVLRLLAFTSKSGRLLLDDGDRAGRVDLVDGRVRDASGDAQRLPLARRALGTGVADGDTVVAALDGFDQLPTDLELARSLADQGVDAGQLAELVREQTLDGVFDLLRWPQGHFRFSAPAVDAAGSSVLDLALPVDELLAEATERLEAWADLAERTGPLDAVVSVRRPRGDGGGVELPADGWTLLSMIDGRRTVGDLVVLSGQGEHRTRQTLAALLDADVVEVGATGGSGPLERLLRDHHALRDREVALGGAADAAPAPAPALWPAAGADAGGDAAADSDAVVATGPDDRRGPDAGPDTDQVVPLETAPATAASDATDTVEETSGRSLRTKVRTDRLRTDPNVDEDLVSRLIEGVEGL